MKKRRRFQRGGNPFGSVVSGYVDPTPQGLDLAYQRHMDNLIRNESLRRQAYSLRNAPFKGDEEMRRRLLQQTDDALTRMTDAASQNSFGNLSNFTTGVLRAGTLYEQGAAPIQQNLQAYTEYQQGLQKDVQDGNLDPEDADINMLMSKSGYEGLQVGPDGQATNFFSGVTPYYDPGLQDMIDKALDNIKVDGVSVRKRLVGQGPGGMYVFDTKEGRKYISAEKVEAALQSVFADQRVQGYYGRKAIGRVMKMEDSEVVDTLTKTAGRLRTLQPMGPDGKLDEDQIRAYNEEASELEALVASGKINDMRNELSERQKEGILDTYKYSAISAGTQMEVETADLQYYDPLWMKMQEARMSAANSAGLESGVVFTDEAITFDRLGNGTPEGHMSYIATLESQYNDMVQTLADGKRKGISNDKLLGYAHELEHLERQIQHQNRVFESIYGTKLSEIYQSEEYQELREELANNRFYTEDLGTAGRAGQFFSELWDDISAPFVKDRDLEFKSMQWAHDLGMYWRTKGKMNDIIEEYDLGDDPRGSKEAVSIQYVGLDEMGVSIPKGTEQNVIQWLSNGGLTPQLQVINKDSAGSPGTMMSLEEYLAQTHFDDGWFGDSPTTDMSSLKATNVLMPRTMMPGSIPEHVRVQYTGKDKGGKVINGSVLVPLGAGGINFPALEQATTGSHSWRLVRELESLAQQGNFPTGETSINYSGTSKDGNRIAGVMDVFFDQTHGTEVLIKDAAGNPIGNNGRMDINDPTFTQAVQNNQIVLRNLNLQ
jgi:hypothetical protein